MKSPKVFWDDILELDAYIRSNTALYIFKLDGMTPKTKILGEKSDITTFSQFRGYQSVYFRYTSVTFPGYKLVLGRHYGPSIDVEPPLTAKIIRKNRQQVHRYTYRALIPDELVNPDDIKACDEFDTAIEEKLGPAASDKFFESNP